MSSFFLKKGSNKKRKSAPTGANSAPLSSRKKSRSSLAESANEDVIDSDEEAFEPRPDAGYESDPEEVKESAEEKRLRLAKTYLEEIEKEEKARAEDSAALHDAVNQRLKRDDLEEAGKLKQKVAHKYRQTDFDQIVFRKDNKCHKEPLTCVVVSPCGSYAFTGSKDAGITKWALPGGERLGRILGGRRKMEGSHKGHCSVINAMAISSDGKFLAAGDSSNLIHIWNPSTLELLKTFRGHRDFVSGLAFRKKTHTLYSCSYDRTVKIWNLDEMTYVETLFGHQDKISGIDSGVRERCVTSGGRDSTVRVFKVVEESQLVFNGPQTSIDSVKLINEEHMITCGEDGHLSLWGVMKKKPIFTVKNAHGKDPKNDQPYWLSSIASLPMSDLIASGSCDGYIRLWKCSSNFRSLEEIQCIRMPGFVNGLSFSPDGKYLVAAVGQAHRLGNWTKIKETRNCLAIIPLNVKEEDDEQAESGEEEGN